MSEEENRAIYGKCNNPYRTWAQLHARGDRQAGPVDDSTGMVCKPGRFGWLRAQRDPRTVTTTRI